MAGTSAAVTAGLARTRSGRIMSSTAVRSSGGLPTALLPRTRRSMSSVTGPNVITMVPEVPTTGSESS